MPKKKLKKFKRVLVANRGEIALRVIRSLKEMGIEAIAVYSDEDIKSPYVYSADIAKHLGKAPSAESYLNIKKIIDIAKKTKADAIHPGYGFLAENSLFVEACEKRGIDFIGPGTDAIKKMGDKIESRLLMKKAKVPIIPGNTEGISEDQAKILAKKIGYPVLLKATAGGGGKGMRKVSSEKEIREAYRLASSEAKKAFGNPTLYIEKFIEKPRHVEVQILGDEYGTVTHVYNRECSIQRRHQKIIEEAPAPNLSNETAKKMFSVACKAAKVIGYKNAGTVEFIVDKNENFYFLEMNTRLQVEHPVTEMITGLDLVKEQINISQGGKVLSGKKLPEMRGSSIECRIYAEDPENNFSPSPGMIKYLKDPSGSFVRVDSGIWEGSKVSLFYDPLLSKLITWGRERDEAVARMIRALNEYKLVGIKSNLGFLKWVIASDWFAKGKLSTNLLEEKMPYRKKAYTQKELNIILAAMTEYNNGNRSVSNGKGQGMPARMTPWKSKYIFEEK